MKDFFKMFMMITNTNMTVMQTAIAGPSDIKTNGGFNHY